MKALATLAAELGIRRETMDKLEVPKHYEPGAEFLRLSGDIDKEGNGRPLWLSPRARAALEAVAPARGRIFSGFHYLKTFRAAARTVVGEERARHLTLRDLRHRCLTDIAEREGLAAAAYVGGHRSTETGWSRVREPASRLGRGRFACASPGGPLPTRHRTRHTNRVGTVGCDFLPGFPADTEGFEPTTSPSGGERSIQLSYASIPVFTG